MKLKRYNFFFFVFISLFLSYSARGEGLDSTKNNQHFELSFGQSLLFISNTKITNIRNQAKLVVPTNAILFFAEFRPAKRFRYPIFLSIPTETKQFIINGQITYEKASPTAGLGIQVKVFQIDIDNRSNLLMEVGPLLSFIFDRQGKMVMAPLFAGRFKISRGENFVMYCGLSYSFGIKALGILYGTGTVF